MMFSAQKVLFLCSLLLILHLSFNARTPTKKFGRCKKNQRKGLKFSVANVTRENPAEIFNRSSFANRVDVISSYWSELHPNERLHFDIGLSNHRKFLSAEPHMQGFLATVLTAYKRHIPLILSPDDFWLLIALSVGQFIGDDPQVAEKYRQSFVQHKGQKELVVTIPKQALFGDRRSKAKAWMAAFEDMCQIIKNETASDLAQLMTQPFSTTGPVEKTVMHATLKETMKNYFEFRYRPICGIPSITLEGRARDYKSIIKRVDRLMSILPTFKWYLARVRLHLSKIHATRTCKGRHRKWWNSMIFYYATMPDSCGGDPRHQEKKERFNGWLGDFIAFKHENGQLSGRPRRNEYGGILFGNFNKPAVTMTEFKIMGQKNPMKLAAGFLGVALDKKKKAIRPAIGWATLEINRDG